MYFKNDRRDDFVNSLGNMMILDKKTNIKLSDKPIYYRYTHVLSKQNHWAFKENGIGKFLKNNNKNNVPNEDFFNQRQKKLIHWFEQILDNNLFV